MKKIVLGFFLFFTLAGFGQNDQVYSNEKIVGKNLVDGSSIKGIEYVFPDRIHETFLDTTTGFLTAQLRGVSRNGKWLNNSGTIIQYDIKNKRCYGVETLLIKRVVCNNSAKQ